MSFKIWIILLIVIISSYFLGRKSGLLKFGPEPSEKIWEEQKYEEIPLSPSPSQLPPKAPIKINFSQTGNLVRRENGAWALLYEEPGNPALQVKLVFTPQSVCDFEKGGRCNQLLFTEGERVKVEGEKTDDEVIVAGMTKLLSE